MTCRYYVWDIEPVKPLVLVHEDQVHQLLKEINSALGLGLKITDEQREEGFISRFPDHPRCRPRYLGRSNTREQFEDMVSQAPPGNFQAAGEEATPSMDGRTLEMFKQMMEDAWELQKNKSKTQKEKRKQERITKQKTMTQMFKRTQRYLGLRATHGEYSTSVVPFCVFSRLVDYSRLVL